MPGVPGKREGAIEHRRRGTPRVSIGMPVYNGAQFLEQAIESILAQTFTDLELVISDNASDDDTAAISNVYARKDSRIRYHRQSRNVGAAANYNFVFARSRGTFFKWAAHDDLTAPTFVERCVGAFDPVRADAARDRQRRSGRDFPGRFRVDLWRGAAR